MFRGAKYLVASIMKEINTQGVQERRSRRLKRRAKVINPDAPMPLPVALGLLPLSSFFSLHRHNLHPRSRCALEDSRICGNIWLQADSFARKKSRTFSNSKPEKNMASMKSWISPDLLSHDARAWNFTLFLQQLSFYLQQHFIFAATFKKLKNN